MRERERKDKAKRYLREREVVCWVAGVGHRWWWWWLRFGDGVEANKGRGVIDSYSSGDPARNSHRKIRVPYARKKRSSSPLCGSAGEITKKRRGEGRGRGTFLISIQRNTS
jgi:hypothetical protein